MPDASRCAVRADGFASAKRVRLGKGEWRCRLNEKPGGGGDCSVLGPPSPSAFSQVALRVLQLANNENVQLHQLSELISSDPAFASEVLTIANSLLYAPRFPASSVLQAIAVLGANNLQGLCLTVGVRGYMGKALNQPAMRAIWRHNLACALIADQLASVGFIDRDVAYTSGVMHDIGRLALAVIRPRNTRLLLETHSGPPASILNAEQEMFGWDHCEAGRQLIIDWNMPAEFEPIVAEHHAPRQKDGSWGMADVINVSCRMADAEASRRFRGARSRRFPNCWTNCLRGSARSSMPRSNPWPSKLPKKSMP